MFNHKVTLWAVGAALGWIGGLSLAVVQMFTPHQIGPLGIVLACFGATLTVQHCLHKVVSHNRESFEIGRQAGAASAVRAVH